MAVPNEHIYEAKVIRDPEYLHTVEAAMMQVAFEMIDEPPETEGYGNRQALVAAVIRVPDDRARFAEMFGWWTLYNPEIRAQVFVPADTADPIKPQNIDGVALRTLIKNGWNYAANYRGTEGGVE